MFRTSKSVFLPGGGGGAGGDFGEFEGPFGQKGLALNLQSAVRGKCSATDTVGSYFFIRFATSGKPQVLLGTCSRKQRTTLFLQLRHSDSGPPPGPQALAWSSPPGSWPLYALSGCWPLRSRSLCWLQPTEETSNRGVTTGRGAAGPLLPFVPVPGRWGMMGGGTPRFAEYRITSHARMISSIVLFVHHLWSHLIA